jgi:hypothetical protein
VIEHKKAETEIIGYSANQYRGSGTYSVAIGSYLYSVRRADIFHTSTSANYTRFNFPPREPIQVEMYFEGKPTWIEWPEDYLGRDIPEPKWRSQTSFLLGMLITICYIWLI